METLTVTGGFRFGLFRNGFLIGLFHTRGEAVAAWYTSLDTDRANYVLYDFAKVRWPQ